MRGLFNTEVIVVEQEHLWYYVIHRLGNKDVHFLPKIISMKMNVLAQLRFELTYTVAAV